MSIDFRHHISLTPSRTELGKLGQSVRKQMGKIIYQTFFHTEKELLLTFYSKYIIHRCQQYINTWDMWDIFTVYLIHYLYYTIYYIRNSFLITNY